jgi:hypothetical protein
MRDRRRLPYAVLTPRIPGPTNSNTNLLITLPPPQTPLTPRIPVSTPLINRLDASPNALFVFTRRHGVQRNTAARRCGGGRDAFERGRRDGAAAGAVVRGDFLAEEDAQDGDGGADDGDGGFDGGPNCNVFAVVGEVGLPELDYVDALHDSTDSCSDFLLVWMCEVGLRRHTRDPCSWRCRHLSSLACAFVDPRSKSKAAEPDRSRRLRTRQH